MARVVNTAQHLESHFRSFRFARRLRNPEDHARRSWVRLGEAELSWAEQFFGSRYAVSRFQTRILSEFSSDGLTHRGD